MLVAPLVFRAPSDPAVGPGCFVRPWAAARPLAICSRVLLLVAPRVFRAPEAPAAREARRPHFVRRRASKPARALRSLRRPPHQWGPVAVVWIGASPRSPARHRRRPPAPRPAPAGYAVASNRVGLGARVLSGSAALTAAVLCPPSPSARITSAPPGCWCLFRRVRIGGSVGGLVKSCGVV